MTLQSIEDNKRRFEMVRLLEHVMLECPLDFAITDQSCLKLEESNNANSNGQPIEKVAATNYLIFKTSRLNRLSHDKSAGIILYEQAGHPPKVGRQ